MIFGKTFIIGFGLSLLLAAKQVIDGVLLGNVRNLNIVEEK